MALLDDTNDAVKGWIKSKGDVRRVAGILPAGGLAGRAAGIGGSVLRALLYGTALSLPSLFTGEIKEKAAAYFETGEGRYTRFLIQYAIEDNPEQAAIWKREAIDAMKALALPQDLVDTELSNIEELRQVNLPSLEHLGMLEKQQGLGVKSTTPEPGETRFETAKRIRKEELQSQQQAEEEQATKKKRTEEEQAARIRAEEASRTELFGTGGSLEQRNATVEMIERATGLPRTEFGTQKGKEVLRKAGFINPLQQAETELTQAILRRRRQRGEFEKRSEQP